MPTTHFPLDRRRKAFQPLQRFAVPASGWIRAIREALGMTSGQLARRLGVGPSTLSELEQSEVRGAIRLSTLRRVADALDCTVVYALVTNKPLGETIEARARDVARQRLNAVAHTMRLEDQAVPAAEIERQIDEIARTIKPRALWNEP